MKYTENDFLKIKAMREQRPPTKWKEIAQEFHSTIGSVQGVYENGKKGRYKKMEPAPDQQTLSPPQEQPAVQVPPAPAPGQETPQEAPKNEVRFEDIEKMERPPATLVIGDSQSRSSPASPAIPPLSDSERDAVVKACADALLGFENIVLDHYTKKPLTETEKNGLRPPLEKVLHYYLPPVNEKTMAIIALLVIQGGILTARQAEIKMLLEKNKAGGAASQSQIAQPTT